jgi:integrase/recombinase XerD
MRRPDPLPPGELGELAAAYLAELARQDYSPGTIATRRRRLAAFVGWCRERSVEGPAQLTPALLARHARQEAARVSERTGARLGVATRLGTASIIRDFLSHLVRARRMLHNPALALELPRAPDPLPRAALSAAEAERMLAVPDTATPAGLRDRALLETLYSTAVRRAELAALELGDVDLAGGTVLVREGKGRRDRVVPVGERATLWLGRWLADARPALARPWTGGALFLTSRGLPLGAQSVGRIAAAARRAAGIRKPGGAHMLRHTAATLMLANGADVRSVQEILGHASLGSTQRYTRVAVRELRAVHARTHPGLVPPGGG